MISQPRATDWILWINASLILGLLALGGCSKDETAQTYSEALDHLQKDRFDKAIAGFDKVLQSNSRHAKGLYYLGLAYDKRGQLFKAFAKYTAARRSECHDSSTTTHSWLPTRSD